MENLHERFESFSSTAHPLYIMDPTARPQSKPSETYLTLTQQLTCISFDLTHSHSSFTTYIQETTLIQKHLQKPRLFYQQPKVHKLKSTLELSVSNCFNLLTIFFHKTNTKVEDVRVLCVRTQFSAWLPFYVQVRGLLCPCSACNPCFTQFHSTKPTLVLG